MSAGFGIEYTFDVNRTLLVACLAVVLTALIVVISLATLPRVDRILSGEVVSESAVALAVLAILVLTTRVRADNKTLWLFTVGALLFYAGMIQDLLDEVLDGPPALGVLEDALVACGIFLICFGFIRFVKHQRSAIADIEEARSRMAELSITDGLTGLYNSRHFYERVRQEIERSTRYQRPLSMLLLDIDDFKKHNDEFGHLSGDRVLRRLGDTIRGALRENDTAYRYGGEEFTILLPETDIEQAVVVAERLRETFSKEQFDEGRKKTISIGVCGYASGEEAREFIRRSDEAMYAAKRAGKNRVRTVCSSGAVRAPQPD